MNKEKERRIKEFSVGIIVLCILFFALVTCGEDTKPNKDQPQESAEKEAERNKAKQETARLTACQIAIEKQLKNPKSFDFVFNTSRYGEDTETGNYVVGFDFYAKNSFNAEIIHQAACSFDTNGNLDKALFAPK